MTKENKPLWRDNTYEILGGKAIIYTTLKSGGNYYVRMRLTLEKKYLRQSLRTPDLDTAIQRGEDFVLKTLSDIQSGKKMFGMTLGELADEYLEYRKDDIGLETGITEGRWKTIKTYINALLRYKTPQIKLSGLDLHQFKWLNNLGEEVGGIPLEWNYLCDVESVGQNNNSNPKLIHYTEGGPYFKSTANCEYADNWIMAYKRVNDYMNC
jgi:hypothetical protein